MIELRWLKKPHPEHMGAVNRMKLSRVIPQHVKTDVIITLQYRECSGDGEWFDDWTDVPTVVAGKLYTKEKDYD